MVQRTTITTKEEIWQKWTDRYVDTESPAPLFETDETLTVEYKNYGKDDRRILKRSEEMETLVREGDEKSSTIGQPPTTRMTG